MDGAYKGVGRWEGGGGGGRGAGGGGSGWASQRRALPAIRPQTVVLCSQQMTRMYTNHRIDQDGHWKQLGTQSILISAPQWADRPAMHQLGFTGLAKTVCESRPGYL